MQIVIDTNVIASAIFFGGIPKKIVDLVMSDDIDAYASKEILDEYTATVDYLRNKYPSKAPAVPLIEIEAKCKIVEVHSKIDVCRDSDDNKFIECALDASCYYVVSGDKDLLTIEQYTGIKIVTASEFLEIIEENNNLA